MGIATIALVALALTPSQANGLKIVVISGEDAVNVIQQKTAVAPVIEVRDRNNLPVPGAVVTFSIEGGKAATFAGGANTMTIATNAAGRAAAAAINPLGAGSFQIEVQAAFQGQTVAASIAQTNVLTAAEAAQGAATAAGGGGGGLSGTTIGIVGAAVGGGAIAATQLTGGGGGGDQPAAPTGTTFSGSFSTAMTMQVNNSSNLSGCTIDHAINATLTMNLDARADGSVSGTAEASGTDAVVAATCGGVSLGSGAFTIKTAAVTGSAGSLSFSSSGTDTTPNTGGSQVATNTRSFTGSLSGGVVTGTLTLESTVVVTSPGVTSTSTGRATVAVTLR